MKQFFLLITALFFFFSANAQTQADFRSDSIRRVYERETIFLMGNGSRYVKGGRAFLSGWNQVNLRREFDISPEGAAEYNRYRKLKTISSILQLASLGTTIYGLATINKRGGNEYWTWWGIGLAVSIGGGVVNSQAQNRLQYALWLRNRDAVSRPQDRGTLYVPR